MEKRVFAFFAVVMMVCLAACNTVQGIGKDVQKGGQAIERVAK